MTTTGPPARLHAERTTGASPVAVEILWWLAPAGVVTLLAMFWATWAARPRRDERDRSEAAYERVAAAMAKEHPMNGRGRPVAVRDRSTGIAVRPSRRGE